MNLSIGGGNNINGTTIVGTNDVGHNGQNTATTTITMNGVTLDNSSHIIQNQLNGNHQHQHQQQHNNIQAQPQNPNSRRRTISSNSNG